MADTLETSLRGANAVPVASSDTPQIAIVSLFPNGMVAVFDARGQQIPRYQGAWDEKSAEILANMPASARVERW